MDIKPEVAIAGLALGLGAALMISKVSNTSASQAGAALGSAAVNAVDGVASGAIIAAGQVVGVPATNMDACELACAEGRTWDASFACPASRFLNYLTTGK